MTVIIKTAGGGNMPLEIFYVCTECGNALKPDENNFRVLVHPTHEDTLIFKGKKIDCQYVGQRVFYPTFTLFPAT